MNLVQFTPASLSESTSAALPRERLLRLPEVEAIAGIKKSTIYELINKGEFPRGITFGRIRMWPESAVQRWVQDRIQAAQGA